MGATVRLFTVQSVSLALMKREPPVLAVTVQGLAATPGYNNIRLNILKDELSPDGILDMELVGDAPDGIVLSLITPVSASIVIEKDVENIVGVIVHSRSNSITELLAAEPGVRSGSDAQTAGFGPNPFPPAPHPFFKTWVFGEEMWKRPHWFIEGKLPLILERDLQRFHLIDPIGPVSGGAADINPLPGVEMRNPFGGRSA
jgi:hypothetical protein